MKDVWCEGKGKVRGERVGREGEVRGKRVGGEREGERGEDRRGRGRGKGRRGDKKRTIIEMGENGCGK